VQTARLTAVAQDAAKVDAALMCTPSKGKIPMKIFDTKTVAVLALGALTLIGAPTFAAPQDGKTSTADRQERRIEKHANGKARNNAQARGGANGLIMGQLNLSPEQKQQIRPIVKASREQMRTIRQDTALTPEQKRTRLQEARMSQQEQIARILTPEQSRRLEELQQQKRAERRQNRSQRGQKSSKSGGTQTQ
jgi:Spy/CpxP family protein refolding chaperone